MLGMGAYPKNFDYAQSKPECRKNFKTRVSAKKVSRQNQACYQFPNSIPAKGWSDEWPRTTPANTGTSIDPKMEKLIFLR